MTTSDRGTGIMAGMNKKGQTPTAPGSRWPIVGLLLLPLGAGRSPPPVDGPVGRLVPVRVGCAGGSVLWVEPPLILVGRVVAPAGRYGAGKRTRGALRAERTSMTPGVLPLLDVRDPLELPFDPRERPL